MKQAILYSLFQAILAASCSKVEYKPSFYKFPQDHNTIYKRELKVVPPSNVVNEKSEITRQEARKKTALRLAEDCKEEVEHKEARKKTALRLAEDCKQKVVCRRQKIEKQAVINIPKDAIDPIVDRYIDFTFGRNVNAFNISGETPLIEALKNLDADDPSMFMLLLHPGIDLDRKAQYGSFGGTALHWAAVLDKHNVVKMLIDNGADMNTKDNIGGTVLHWATFSGKHNVVKMLIDNGADVNTKDNTGTALHLATRYNRCDIIGMLIDNGADVNTKDNTGRTALHLAATFGHQAVARLLRDAGAHR